MQTHTQISVRKLLVHPHTPTRMHRQEHCYFVRVCLFAHTQYLCVPVFFQGVRCVLGRRDVGESVKSGWVGDLKGG